MSAHHVRLGIGSLLAAAGVVGIFTSALPEHQAIGLIFFGIAIAIWPKGTGKPKG